MGQRVIRIVSYNKEQNLNKWQSRRMQRSSREGSDVSQNPNFSHHHSQAKMNGLTPFVQAYNPSTTFNKNNVNNNLNDFHDYLLKKAFEKNNKPLLATGHVKSLQNLLNRARFDVVPKPIALLKNIGLFNSQDKTLLHCHNCIYHCKEFKFKLESGR